MSKSEMKYIALLLGIFALYVLFENARPKPVDWRITLSKEDKIPFGAWVMEDLLSDHFGEVHTSNRTIYEIIDTVRDENLMILAKDFSTDMEDLDILLQWVSEGSTLFLASESFGLLGDTLHLELGDYMQFDSLFFEVDLEQEDSVFIRFVNPDIEDHRFYFAERHITEHFTSFDTLNSNILAVNWNDEPVMLERSWGDGRIILSTIPIAYTNYYLLKGDNHKLADFTASYFSENGVLWTEYYQSGRKEAMTPLRFILSEEPLKWGYYIALFSLMLFILFRIKRKQRIIPVILPLRNATKDFTKTVGNLYMHHNDHKNAVEKKVSYFYEFIRSHYFLNTNLLDEEFYERLSHKSGKSREKVDHLFKMIIFLQSRDMVSRTQLLDLNTKIDEFYTK